MLPPDHGHGHFAGEFLVRVEVEGMGEGSERQDHQRCGEPSENIGFWIHRWWLWEKR